MIKYDMVWREITWLFLLKSEAKQKPEDYQRVNRYFCMYLQHTFAAFNVPYRYQVLLTGESKEGTDTSRPTSKTTHASGLFIVPHAGLL